MWTKLRGFLLKKREPNEETLFKASWGRDRTVRHHKMPPDGASFTAIVYVFEKRYSDEIYRRTRLRIIPYFLVKIRNKRSAYLNELINNKMENTI
jgi:hypothetical protein